jgi:quercetin dioxygenase-like cupin family protein
MKPFTMIKAGAVAVLLCAAAIDSYSAAPGSAGQVVPKFSQALANIPGKVMIAVEVTFAPGQVSPPHRHAKSAFIFAYVLSGAILSQVEGQPAKTYHAGESWYENPGAHHVQATNVSKTKPAKLLAVFVVDEADKELTVVDPK